MREVIITSILKGFDRKNLFFEECSRFKLNNLTLVLGMVLKSYTSVEKELTLKVRKFLELLFPPRLNKVNNFVGIRNCYVFV